MAPVLPFGEVLEAADQLSLGEKEALIEVLNRRIIEARQDGLVQDIEKENREFREGKVLPTTPDDLRSCFKILKDLHRQRILMSIWDPKCDKMDENSACRRDACAPRMSFKTVSHERDDNVKWRLLRYEKTAPLLRSRFFYQFSTGPA